MTLLENYLFELPSELIAQKPLKERDASRMMVVNRKNATFSHSYIKEIVSFLEKGDLLVLNDTKVMQCRIMARKQTGGIIEMLFLKEHTKTPICWEVMLKPLRRVKEGDEFYILSSPYKVRLVSKLQSGRAIIHLNIDIPIEQLFEKYGLPPLPPYIKRDYTKYDEKTLAEDKQRYQTVYAQKDGSVAAPTAGLHFSDTLLASLKKKGIKIAKITLHVGPGTFVPITTQHIESHTMESEHYEISQENADLINETKKSGHKVIAVGSTVVRTLETVGQKYKKIVAERGETNLFIYPPFDFKIVDGMLTNFHLPGSTLIVMVAAFAGYDLIMKAYKEAIKERYRFFSFGDCMLIL